MQVRFRRVLQAVGGRFTAIDGAGGHPGSYALGGSKIGHRAQQSYGAFR